MTETLFNESGQLPNPASPIYIVPASTQAIVKRVSFVNVSAVPVTANLWFKPAGGTARRIAPVDVAIAAGLQVEFDLVTMGPGDSLDGGASVAASVDYAIFGVEIT